MKGGEIESNAGLCWYSRLPSGVKAELWWGSRVRNLTMDFCLKLRGFESLIMYLFQAYRQAQILYFMEVSIPIAILMIEF